MAMGNASDAVKRAADYITTDVDHDGIIMFAILCAVLQANPLLAFVCAIVYGTTGCLLYTSRCV